MNRNKKVVIIDYHLGNLFSVNQALSNIGLNAVTSSTPEEIVTADALVLPGVGAFADAMDSLTSLNLIEPIQTFVQTGKPFMGICLGLQLLFTSSEEFGNYKGLDIIKGTVKKFDTHSLGTDEILKVPQIGWNQIFPADIQWMNSPLSTVNPGEYLYFVHSFYVIPSEDNITLTQTSYGNYSYTSSILKNNIFACQFHPEKSGPLGLEIYKSWALVNKLF